MSFFANRRRGSFNPPSLVSPYIPVATSFVWVKDPSTVNIHAFGLTDTVVAQVLDQRLAPMVPQPAITYTSGTPANLSISGNTLTAVANGTSLITASTTGFTNLTGTATSQQVVASITGVSSPLNTDDASSGTFAPVAKDSTNHTVTSATFTFTSLNSSVITVNSSGNWAGQSAGNTTINIVSGPVTFPVACNVIHVTGNILMFGQSGSQLTTLSGYPGFIAQLEVRYGPSWTSATDITSRVIFATSNQAIVIVDPPGLTSISPSTLMQGTAGTFIFTDSTNNIKGNELVSGLPLGVTASSYSYTASTVTCTLTATGSATLGNAALGLTCNRGTSPTQNITVVVPGPTPLPVSGSVLRLHADWNITQVSGSISEWDDLIGNYAFVQATGTNKPSYIANAYNSKHCLRLSGNQWLAMTAYLAAINPVGGQFMIYVVAKNSTTTETSGQLRPIFSSIGTNTGYTIAEYDWNGQYHLMWGQGSSFGNAASGSADTTTLHALTGLFDQSQPTKQNLLVDNTSVSGTAGSFSNNTTTPACIGTSSLSPGTAVNNFVGDICEIIVFPSTHTILQMNSMHTYFQSEWGTL